MEDVISQCFQSDRFHQVEQISGSDRSSGNLSGHLQTSKSLTSCSQDIDMWIEHLRQNVVLGGFPLYILRCNIRSEAIVMNLRIPIVCLVFSVVIIGACIVARETAAQPIEAAQQMSMPATYLTVD